MGAGNGNNGGAGGGAGQGGAAPDGSVGASNTLKFGVRLAHVSGPSRKRVVEERVGDLAEAEAPTDARQAPAGRMPRVTRLLVQAHHFQRMLDRGEAADLADIARRFRLSRARVTQVMGLTLLAPDIQEEILFLPPIPRGSEPLSAIDLRAVLQAAGWAEQRTAFRSRRRSSGSDCSSFAGTSYG
jgi:hypothetical protein